MKNTVPESPSLILIVDDEPFIRAQLRLSLQCEGYRTAEAEDGRKALTIFQELQPDIVLLDAIMPDLDGFECCTRLQLLEDGKYTPVLMITGLEDQESVDRAFEVGAIDYVTKPIHWPVLRQRVKRLIQQSHLQQKLEAANRELQRLVTIDELTQVANRRRFEEYCAQEWQRMARDQLPLSLILCDVDFFKAYNDTYGHRAGDRCLQLVAKAIENCVNRPADVVARYGGEEFAVILPRTYPEGAIHLANAICSAVRELQIPHLTSQANTCVTISAGVATEIPVPNSDFQEIIDAADRALYQAKMAGRDRCQQYIKQSSSPVYFLNAHHRLA
ncbi:response regulator receiver modulated diguanylate cyclase [Trichormus variabilis ATCC 29413]|uniref:Response regulator receiver modulated diguanylate cyclase n=2 Tax=Anabaena variabilis TaxID=264691 RepID=Q3MED2_TRIV2|nr:MULTISPECIES: PleD family two-component system response regulator [Nostocaceae]ABA20654.1 response regulator receiver modulated diguanylate cyclase [Trichormus variabilis ATCC 29413]MBC1215020.1 PleD family two-component system response regulator [Trichormus variabilis ARAD]MBC1255084.1 PleD family two-component system response regulator [Trichormus variabilis V5]MBC1269289.1 PleD family two-component system response regulator [Trichormus variabilis FSR]MBC1300922.1 PleD family two-componen